MDSKSWQRLFESFRPEDQNQLVVSVLGGLDVAVQNVARIEEEIVMIRGRVAGEADAGRLFLIPYERVTSVFVNRAVILEEVELFSPSISRERKQKVAAQVAELAAKEKNKECENSTRTDLNAPMNLKEQLERLREQAGFPGGASKPENIKTAESRPAESRPVESRPAAEVKPAESRPITLHAPSPTQAAPSLPTSPRSQNPASKEAFNGAQTVSGTPTLPPRLSSPKPTQTM